MILRKQLKKKLKKTLHKWLKFCSIFKPVLEFVKLILDIIKNFK